jgi:predicted enzyme related to lactoylglutathione lyase
MATEAALARLPDLTVHGVSAVIPAKDFQVSKAFYAALGWRVRDLDPTLAVMELAGHRIHLQNFYVRRWAEYVVLHIGVQDACAWYDRLSLILRRKVFPGAHVQRPKIDLDGSLVTCAQDPSGVTLHFTQWDS